MIIHSFLPSSGVNGPGNRTVVWTQGCLLNCDGCWNPDTHNFHFGENPLPSHLADRILAAGAEGVTFSGGEPLHQAAALANTIAILKHRRPDFSVGMYTGYTLREASRGEFFHPRRIRNHAKGKWDRTRNIGWWEGIQKNLDFAVMGRYNRLKPCSLPLRSSTNQQLHLFSNRYTEDDFTPQQVEFNITSDLIEITGFPTREIYANV